MLVILGLWTIGHETFLEDGTGGGGGDAEVNLYVVLFVGPATSDVTHVTICSFFQLLLRMAFSEML